MACADVALHRAKHVAYFRSFLGVVPGAYLSLDTSRLMILYFSLSALDVLGALDEVVDASLRRELVEFVYAQQVVVDADKGEACGGFLGGGFTGPMQCCSGECVGTFTARGSGPCDAAAAAAAASVAAAPAERQHECVGVTKYHQAHVSMTYVALLVLTILGDDLSRVDRESVVRGLRSLQLADGSFQAVAFGTESDMRFVFCACAVSFMLQDWRGVDLERCAAFVLGAQSFDGGFGILPEQETHAGAVYVAVAALRLMGRLGAVADRSALEEFLVSRQVGGFNGRINKEPDTCYTFWAGGSLQLLGLAHLIDCDSARRFVMSCQSKIGGFSKHPGDVPRVYPDILHAYYSLCGLSLMGEPGLAALDASLGLTERAFRSGQWNRAPGGPKTGAGTPYATAPGLAATTAPPAPSPTAPRVRVLEGPR
jgi:geranylgeranyl transferase type-1 subunit beta